MEVIYLNHPHQLNKEDIPPISMALGYFDGIHLGHKAVIEAAKQAAAQKGLKTAVMSFDPHPSVVLGKTVQHVEYITPLAVKIELMNELDIDYLFIVRFTEEFASLLPQEFVDQYVINLNVKHVVAGFDYSYGRMGQGTMETLPFHARDQFTHSVVEELQYGGKKISSTLIRSYIHEGKTDQLPPILGRFYSVSGPVVHGEKRGRTIGFPTANVDVSDDYLLPPTGVYAVRLTVTSTGQTYEGVCNVGYKPTFHRDKVGRPTVEVFIFHFDGDLYDESVTIEWHLYLRGEKRFLGIEQLITQIQQDKENAQHYFEKYSL